MRKKQNTKSQEKFSAQISIKTEKNILHTLSKHIENEINKIIQYNCNALQLKTTNYFTVPF